MMDNSSDTSGEEVDNKSENFSTTHSDSWDESDSEDSSDIDLAECDRRRTECLDLLSFLERQFLTLREQLYAEKKTQLMAKIDEIKLGFAKEYTIPLEKLREEMKNRIELAEIHRKVRLESIENTFKAEELAARQNFENDKRVLFESLKEELEEKIRKLEEDKYRDDFHNDRNRRRKSSRKLWKRRCKSSETNSHEPASVTGPHIVYMLSDSEILEDLVAMKNAVPSSKQE